MDTTKKPVMAPPTNPPQPVKAQPQPQPEHKSQPHVAVPGGNQPTPKT